MSNFDFLKNFNNELYEIGLKLEDDVIKSPRAVTADATQFLETLVKDIYRLSKHKLEKNLISFYKKIDNLYRSGVISYIYKNKLQDAYNLRNKIHNNIDDDEEEKLAFDLHQRLFYISKKYFQDYNDDKYITVPEYKKPEFRDINFDNCIICGCDNQKSSSNMCDICNKKIEQGNFLLSFKNKFESEKFTRQDLIQSGISESECISLLRDLSKENIIINNGGYYIFNDENLELYLADINEYIEISILITKFYNNEISARKIKTTEEYYKGLNNQKPYCEFYRLVNVKTQCDFEKDLLKTENIHKSRKVNAFTDLDIQNWFSKQKVEFSKGKMNDAFILYNEILIKEYFKLKRKGYSDSKVFNQLELSSEIFDFWQDEFMGDDFLKTTNNIKKELIISKIRNNKTLTEAIKSAGLTHDEFDKLYIISKNLNDNFYKTFEREYTQKRQKLFVKHLRNNNLNSTVRLTKISKNEFIQWYKTGEINYSDFYIQTTRILMNRYLTHRKNGWNKGKILKHLGISNMLFQSWSKHDDLDLFRNFHTKNKEITESLIKRGRIINALKEGKSKDEAIFAAGLTPKEFLDIYNTSKIEKTDFHIRFDEEYVENRKRLFANLITENDFFNAIEKCEISQIDFNRWYLKDQDIYLSELHPTDFYLKTTTQFMEDYLQARRDGKNKPDAARSVGLSNIIVNKWLNHTELNLFKDFAKNEKQLTIDLIVKGFNEGKSKTEVSEAYDIPISLIDDFIKKGKSGLIKYKKISCLYEREVIPKQLKIFLEDFDAKPFNKALKNSKLTKEELIHFYNLGKSGDKYFTEFYDDFIALKKSLYVKNIISKKSQKIALKNSYLTKSEFREFKEELDSKIFVGRLAIVADELSKSKSNGSKLSKKLGISLNEFYNWYLKGRDGEKGYHEFYMMVNISMIFPRIAAFKSALEIGVPKNWLLRKLKKDIGSKDYKIWMDNDFLNTEFNAELVDLEDYDGPLDFLDKLEDVKVFSFTDNGEIADMLKDTGVSNRFTKTIIKYTSDGENIIKKEIVGK